MPFHLQWSGPVFAVKAYWKNNDSYEAARREFRRHFQLGRDDPVPGSTAFSTATRGIIWSVSTHSGQNIVFKSQIASIQTT